MTNTKKNNHNNNTEHVHTVQIWYSVNMLCTEKGLTFTIAVTYCVKSFKKLCFCVQEPFTSSKPSSIHQTNLTGAQYVKKSFNTFLSFFLFPFLSSTHWQIKHSWQFSFCMPFHMSAPTSLSFPFLKTISFRVKSNDSYMPYICHVKVGFWS